LDENPQSPSLWKTRKVTIGRVRAGEEKSGGGDRGGKETLQKLGEAEERGEEKGTISWGKERGKKIK